jgi:hypothetical protein
MNKLLLPLVLLALLATACNKDDDNAQINYQASWQTNAGQGDTEAVWLFFNTADGAVAAESSGLPGDILAIDLQNDDQRLDLTQLTKRQYTSFTDSAQVTLVEHYELTTYLNVPSDFTLEGPAVDMPDLRNFTILGVTSVEELIWPERANTNFGESVFFSPQNQSLSFQIPISAAQPAYLKIRANGESTQRYIWIGNIREALYTYQYNDLPQVQEQSPVSLPNNALWFFRTSGISGTASAAIDYPVQPAFVEGSFTTHLPTPGDVPSFRLTAYDIINSTSGDVNSPSFYDKILLSLPAAIPAANFELNLSRKAPDSLQLNTLTSNINAVQLSVSALINDNIRITWTIHGAPALLEQYLWPQWPAAASADYSSLMAAIRVAPIMVFAKRFDNDASYASYLRAKAVNQELWEAEQGLLGTKRIFE